MPTKLTLSGIVIDQGSEKRLNGATVRLEVDKKVFFAETNADGKFTFQNIDEPKLNANVEKYNVSITAYYKDGKQKKPVPRIIDIEKGTTSKDDVVVEILHQGPVSNQAGVLFLIVLVGILIGIGCWYYHLHQPKSDDDGNSIAKKELKDVNPKIVNALTENLVDRITADSIKVSAFEPKAEGNLIDSTDQAFITAEFKQIEEATHQLFKASQIDSSLQALVKRNLEDVEQAIANRKKEEIQAALVSSKARIKEVQHFKPSWFWQIPYKVYYEILFWALFATLLRLIGDTGYYIKNNRFLVNSIPNQTALIFTIPVLAFLITLIISFFKITITIGGSKEFSLDFSNPYTSIIVAALIGLAPWEAWTFMRALAKRLFEGLKNWLGLNKSNGANNSDDKPDNDQKPNP